MDKELMSFHHRNMLHVKPNLRSNISDQNLQTQMQIVYGILDVYGVPMHTVYWMKFKDRLQKCCDEVLFDC